MPILLPEIIKEILNNTETSPEEKVRQILDSTEWGVDWYKSKFEGGIFKFAHCFVATKRLACSLLVLGLGRNRDFAIFFKSIAREINRCILDSWMRQNLN
jgi:hypothetical protein